MHDAYIATKGELADRLVAALRAGESAGGDKRGKQSAAVLVVRPTVAMVVIMTATLICA
jgi:uncharacterized Ntn-hydrolase superfamily protein